PFHFTTPSSFILLSILIATCIFLVVSIYFTRRHPSEVLPLHKSWAMFCYRGDIIGNNIPSNATMSTTTAQMSRGTKTSISGQKKTTAKPKKAANFIARASCHLHNLEYCRPRDRRPAAVNHRAITGERRQRSLEPAVWSWQSGKHSLGTSSRNQPSERVTASPIWVFCVGAGFPPKGSYNRTLASTPCFCGGGIYRDFSHFDNRWIGLCVVSNPAGESYS
ncbi:hypothetical protein B0T20DRAFT_490815, partial [Sordaria brevicollis]